MKVTLQGGPRVDAAFPWGTVPRLQEHTFDNITDQQLEIIFRAEKAGMVKIVAVEKAQESAAVPAKPSITAPTSLPAVEPRVPVVQQDPKPGLEPGASVAEDPPFETLELPALQALFRDRTGQEPGNRNKKTLIKGIRRAGG